MHASATEEGLVALAQGADRSAFDRLVAPLPQRIGSFTKRMIGDPDDTEDVLQETLLKPWSSIGSFEGQSLFSTWLTSVASRAAIDMPATAAGQALYVSDSVLRHRLAAARKSMQDRYDGLWALVGKQGTCHRCSGLQMIAPDDRKGGPFPALDAFEARCKVVRETTPVTIWRSCTTFSGAIPAASRHRAPAP